MYVMIVEYVTNEPMLRLRVCKGEGKARFTTVAHLSISHNARWRDVGPCNWAILRIKMGIAEKKNKTAHLGPVQLKGRIVQKAVSTLVSGVNHHGRESNGSVCC